MKKSNELKEIKYCLKGVKDSKSIGGLRLVYQLKTRLVRELRIPLFGRRYLSIYIPKTLKFKTKEIIFWKPLKEKWDTKRGKLPKNFWGSAKDEYTNLWTIIEIITLHFGDTPQQIVDIIDELRSHRDHQLIKYLNQKKPKFTIFTNYF